MRSLHPGEPAPRVVANRVACILRSPARRRHDTPPHSRTIPSPDPNPPGPARPERRTLPCGTKGPDARHPGSPVVAPASLPPKPSVASSEAGAILSPGIRSARLLVNRILPDRLPPARTDFRGAWPTPTGRGASGSAPVHRAGRLIPPPCRAVGSAQSHRSRRKLHLSARPGFPKLPGAQLYRQLAH